MHADQLRGQAGAKADLAIESLHERVASLLQGGRTERSGTGTIQKHDDQNGGQKRKSFHLWKHIGRGEHR